MNLSLAMALAAGLPLAGTGAAEAGEAVLAGGGAVEVSRVEVEDLGECMTARILVNAPQDVVWRSLKSRKRLDENVLSSRVLERDGLESTLEEQLNLPIVGPETYQVKVTLFPMEKIGYKLIRSERFKTYDGVWRLTPVQGGKATMLELSHRMELNFFVPSFILDRIVGKRVQERVLSVKLQAEEEYQAEKAMDLQ